MRLGSAEEYVGLEIASRLSKADDVLVNVSVACDGFAGNSSQWVLPQARNAFVTELRGLERTRQGQAVLESDFGDAFLLRLFSTDRAGHMAATGMIRWIRRKDEAGALELSFGESTSMGRRCRTSFGWLRARRVFQLLDGARLAAAGNIR